MKILVSACLLGLNCRYSGERAACTKILLLMEKHQLVPVCPEQLGGLPTPRQPSEIRDGHVYAKDGEDVTENYRRGAEEALTTAKLFGCDCALLKERSPSCGFGKVYDGTFSHTVVEGSGVAAALLAKNGIKVYGESQIDQLM